jgi:hypothetical protein
VCGGGVLLMTPAARHRCTSVCSDGSSIVRCALCVGVLRRAGGGDAVRLTVTATRRCATDDTVAGGRRCVGVRCAAPALVGGASVCCATYDAGSVRRALCDGVRRRRASVYGAAECCGAATVYGGVRCASRGRRQRAVRRCAASLCCATDDAGSDMRRWAADAGINQTLS